MDAIWLLAATAVALHGLAPRAITVAWGLLAGCFVVGFLGEVLKLPQRVKDLSPFHHIPELPAADLRLTPLITLSAIAAALVVAGVVGLRRRDIG